MRLLHTAVVLTVSIFASALPTEAQDESAVAVPNTTTVAPTLSPLAAAEHEREFAKDAANQTVHTVMWQEHIAAGFGPEQINQELLNIEAAVPNTTRHWAKERKRMLHREEDQRRQVVHDSVHAAKSALHAFKRAAKSLKKMRREAGVPEDIYIEDYNEDKLQSDHFKDEAKSYGELADAHIQLFFDMTDDRLEEKNDQLEDVLRQQRQQLHEHVEIIIDNDMDIGRDDDDDDESANNDDDGDFGQKGGNQVDEQQILVSVGADDDPKIRADHSKQASGFADTNGSPLNLRAVGSTSTGNGPMIFVALVGMGMLASFALVVQLARRPARHGANQPLLDGAN